MRRNLFRLLTRARYLSQSMLSLNFFRGKLRIFLSVFGVQVGSFKSSNRGLLAFFERIQELLPQH